MSLGTKAVLTVMLGLLLAGACGMAAYHFGSMETRSRMEDAALKVIQKTRTQSWLPATLARWADGFYDQLPGSEGFSVDAGELVREDSHFIAGKPRINRPVQLLHNRSYLNLYDLSRKQTACVAMRLVNKQAASASLKVPFIEDPRIRNVRPSDLKGGQWGAANLAPPVAISRQHGEVGIREANLYSNLAPMNEAFAQGLWPEVTRLLAVRYPQRFEEVWLYLGPVYAPQGPKLASGVPVPDAFYAIVFDITEAGGLRALSLLIPADATSRDLRRYVTTIGQIEAASGIVFLPDLEPHVRRTLAEWRSEGLW